MEGYEERTKGAKGAVFFRAPFAPFALPSAGALLARSGTPTEVLTSPGR